MSTNIIKWIVTSLLFVLPTSSSPTSPCHRSIVIACELIPLPPPQKRAKKLLKGSTRVEESSCCHTTIPAFHSLLFDKGHNVSVAIKSISSVTPNDRATSVCRRVSSRRVVKWSGNIPGIGHYTKTVSKSEVCPQKEEFLLAVAILSGLVSSIATQHEKPQG